MKLSAGSHVGPYEIIAPLGAGGMGEVYRARDTKLDREVAIKILPDAVADDPERIARFEREAKTLAALNHPNIAHIHGLEESSDVRALVMELVEGPTLADCTAQGPLPLAEALAIAKQIAEALEAAHEQGIIHRDLKPANVKVRPDGTVKVLDFGLAKAIERHSGPDATASPTITVPATTGTGVLVGTAAYMSPEQARGKPVDKRTDIWAFGCVLYEMLTGRRAFRGETVSDTLVAILEREPDWTTLRRVTPPGVRRLLEQCLTKDPKRRLRDIGQAWVELDAALGGHASVGSNGVRRRRLRFMLGAALIGLGAIAVVIRERQTLTITRVASPKPDTFTQLTDQPGSELYASLSPDAKTLVYQSRTAGKWDIYAQRVGGRNPVNLTKDSLDDDTQPAFSPDGERIAFRSERDRGGIFIMGATGENVKRLTDFGYNPAWSPDGVEIVCSTGWFLRPEDAGTNAPGQLFRVNVATGEKRLVSGNIDNPKQPSWSPHGDRIAYWAIRRGQRDILTVAASGGEPVPITNDPDVDWNPVWSPDGQYLYFVSDRGGSMNIWRVRIDERSGKTLGALEPVTTPSPSSGFLSFSHDGHELAYVQQIRNWNVYKVDFDPTRETIVGQPVPVIRSSKEGVFPDISPDGRWIAFTSRLKPEDVYVVKTDGTGLRQLTDDIYQDRVPRWSPDGKQIAFMSTRSGRWQIWTIKPDGSALTQATDAPGNGAYIPVWSADGAHLLAQVANSPPGGTPFLLDARKPWQGQSPEKLPATPSHATFIAWSWSVDGRELGGAFLREDGSSDGLAIYSVETRTYDRIAAVGNWPHWLPDNRRLIFYHQGKAWVVDSQSKGMHEILSVAPYEVSWQFGVSRDGRQIAFTLDATEADVWQMRLE